MEGDDDGHTRGGGVSKTGAVAPAEGGVEKRRARGAEAMKNFLRARIEKKDDVDVLEPFFHHMYEFLTSVDSPFIHFNSFASTPTIFSMIPASVDFAASPVIPVDVDSVVPTPVVSCFR